MIGCSVLSLAAGGFLVAVCQRVCNGPPEARVLHSALQSSCKRTVFLLSSAFQHERSTFVNVIGKIAPAMPGS